MRIEQVLPISAFMDDTLDRESIQSEQGVVRKRVNMRPDNIGDVMANVPIPGTVVVNMELPAGENKCVGWTNDNESEGIIWFVYNSLGNHSIFRYNGTVQKIWYGEPSLNLTDNLINAEVVQGRLYWNDNTDHPKSFNIQKAIDYTTGLTTGYTEDDKPFEDNVFPYIKRPPQFAPSVVYEDRTELDGVAINFNNLRKKQWQVKYNFVYEDNQESAYSPISKVPVPSAEVSSAGSWEKEITKNNTLKISVSTGNTLVKTIKVAVRDASMGGPFYKFTEIKKEETSGDTHDVYFLNNTHLESIDDEYGTAYFHDVPLKAKDLLLLDGKNISMSMPTSGYDFDSIDYSLSYTEEVPDTDSDSTPMSSVKINSPGHWWEACGIKGIGSSSYRIHIPPFKPNAVYRFVVKFPIPPSENFMFPDGSYVVKHPDILLTYVAPNEEPNNFTDLVKNNFINQLVDKVDRCQTIPIIIGNGGIGVVRMDFYHCGTFRNTSPVDMIRYGYWWNLWKPMLNDYTSNIYGEVILETFTPTFKSLKKGQYHPFGIVYNDEFGRYNIVHGDEKLYIPPTGGIYKPKITINNLPPSWATTYRIAYIPNNSYTYTMSVPAVEVVEGDGTDTTGVPVNYKFLKINQSILSIIEAFPNSLIEAYVWQNGDRIRQVGSPDSYEIFKEYTRVYTSGAEPITETGFLVDAPFDYIAGTTKVELIEIYRPNLTPQDKSYYEIGEEYPITNGYHLGQTATTSAVHEIDFGDVYYRNRFTGDADVASIYVEDSSYSDYYISPAIGLGRGAVRIESKQTTLKRAIISENYIQDSKLNRLNIFLPLGQVYEVSEIYGDITKMIERGDTLKIIQPHKETSVYIGKNYAKDADGNDIVLVSDKTFGSDNVYEAYLGSTYPRAVAANEKTFYFFDLFTGDFCRSATNGTISLSKQYRYQRELDKKAREFRQYSGAKDIIVSVSPNDSTIYLTFITDTIETIAFSDNEGNKGFMFWVEFSNGDLKPENFAWYGDDMYSFVNGKLHIHGQGAVNSFYGSERKSASIEMITNQKIQKKYEAVSLDTNGSWTATMEIEKDNNYPFGQKTRILNFKNKGGRLYSSVPRNIITRNGSENLQKLYSGNEMLGNAMKITVESVNFDKLRELKIISTTN